MATMIPSVLAPTVSSSAERRVFEWFQRSHNTDGWVVLHSLGISAHNRVIYGETDFFVLAPHMGLFALEVKGGRVRREKGVWYFTNKYGTVNSKVRGPFEQANDGAFSVMAALKKRLDQDHYHLENVLFGSGVMFPDIEYEATGIDEDQWQVFDSRDRDDVRGFVERVSTGTRRKWKGVYGSFDESRLPTAEDVRYLASLLRGDFDYALSISAQLRNADEQLISLTSEQYRCLDQLDDNPRCLIEGMAGTGKTLLALEEVKKSVARGEKTALFCYNANLAEWLRSYFNRIPNAMQPDYVGTLHKFMVEAVRNGGKSVAAPDEGIDLQDFYRSDLPLAAVHELSAKGELFDKIVVDEAQDLICPGYLDVFDTCLRRGITRGRWTMFGDFSMQAIYANGESGDSLKALLEDRTSFIRFKLTLNCRNTRQIIEEIQTVTGVVTPAQLLARVEGPPVNYVTYGSEEEQRDKLTELIDELVRMCVEPCSITILSPYKRENSVVSMLSGYEIREFSANERSSITFSTIQAYKGLENTVIILTDIDSFSRDKLMYVGLSRARSGLYVLESDLAAKEYLSLLQRRLLGE